MLRTHAQQPSVEAENRHKKIRVCIRGICGLLAQRLARGIRKNPDMELAVGIAKNDPTLESTLLTCKQLPETILEQVVAERMYLDDNHAIVRQVNASNPFITFMPADQLVLSKECDFIVDAGSPGSVEKWMETYCASQRIVLLQSGEKSTRFRISIALDYKYIAVLQNIDAIRILEAKVDAIDAMRITDENMGFVESK